MDMLQPNGEKTCLASEEEEDVALGLSQVDLHDCDEGGVHVIRLRRAAVQDLNRIGAPRDGEDGATEEVGRELVRIQRRRGHNQLQVRPPLDDALITARTGFSMKTHASAAM